MLIQTPSGEKSRPRTGEGGRERHRPHRGAGCARQDRGQRWQRSGSECRQQRLRRARRRKNHKPAHLPAVPCGRYNLCCRSADGWHEVKDCLSYIQFLGAAGVVTGSKHLIHVDKTGARSLQVLVDCGLFQGQKEWRERNWQDLPVPANTIDAVILTHAHLDHSGWIPRLVKQGFHGPIYATAATVDLCGILLARLRASAGRRRRVLQQDQGIEASSGAAALHHGRGAAMHDAVSPGQLWRGESSSASSFRFASCAPRTSSARPWRRSR